MRRVPVQEVGQVGRVQLPPHAAGGLGGDALGLSRLLRCGFARIHRGEQPLAAVRPHLDDEPVVELGECDVEPHRAARPRAHRDAEARRPRLAAVHPYEHRLLPPPAIGRVDVHEDAVLNRDRVQVAGSEPDEREGAAILGLGIRVHRAVPRDAREHLSGREQVALAGVGAVRPAEQTIVLAPREAVGAWPLLLADAGRQIGGTVDPIEHDRPVADRGADQLVARVHERPQEAVERRPV